MFQTEMTDNNFGNEKKICSNCGAVVLGLLSTRAVDVATTYLLIFIPITTKWGSILLGILF